MSEAVAPNLVAAVSEQRQWDRLMQMAALGGFTDPQGHQGVNRPCLTPLDREARRLRLIVSDNADQADGADVVSMASTVPRLADLPDRERAALMLRYVDDLAVPEVAALLQLSVHATESLLARARTRLRGREARDA